MGEENIWNDEEALIAAANGEEESFLEEMKKQAWLAGPLIFVSLMEYSLRLISLMFLGHLGELTLSGASMATSFTTVTGYILLRGMASALDTFCGQSYGAQQYRLLGIHMQRAMLVLLLACFPISILWANTRHIFTALGQDPDISQEAGHYAQFMIPSIFGYAVLQCQVKFLQTQNIVSPMMIASGITTLSHLFSCWILIVKLKLGSGGAAAATCISYWINPLMLYLYIVFSSSCLESWTGLSREALRDILDFIRLTIPSTIMVCLESWSFEMVVLLSGFLPNPKLETSALSICLNTANIVWMIPFGLSNSASTRVSNELGAGHPRAARLVVNVVLVMAIIVGLLVGLLLCSIRNMWGYAYTNEIQVVHYIASLVPLIAISNLLDGLQCVLSGTVRACGRQRIGALINLGSYYVVGIPMAVFLAFVFHVGGKGLWWGIICALAVQVATLVAVVLLTNWEHEAKKTSVRVHDMVTNPVEILS